MVEGERMKRGKVEGKEGVGRGIRCVWMGKEYSDNAKERRKRKKEVPPTSQRREPQVK